MRAILRLPFELVKQLEGGSLEGYKSPDVTIFGKVYQNSFDTLYTHLSEKGLISANVNESLFINFCSLYFPRSKVLKVAKESDVTQETLTF